MSRRYRMDSVPGTELLKPWRVTGRWSARIQTPVQEAPRQFELIRRVLPLVIASGDCFSASGGQRTETRRVLRRGDDGARGPVVAYWVCPDHSDDEDRYVTMGLSVAGRLLLSSAS
jgi:hypothetical protein